MTRSEFWNALDTVCEGPSPTLYLSDLLRTAYKDDLPLLIACTRTPGRIHHSYTNFDASNPGLDGNRYLICFTSQEQASITPPHSDDCVDEEIRSMTLEERFAAIDAENNTSTAEEDGAEQLSLEERFRLIDEGQDEPAPKKKRRQRRRRKKKDVATPLWKTESVVDTALVSTRAVLDYARRSRAVGGLIFNVYDKAVALPKFMM